MLFSILWLLVYGARQRKKEKYLKIVWGCVIVTEGETKKRGVGTIVLHCHPRFNSGSCS